MIIYGTRARLIGQRRARRNCDFCGQQDTISFTYLIKYFHIFWIPMFPYRKETGSFCSHCQQTLTGKQLAPEWQRDANAEKPRTPLKYYSGLFLGLLFVLLIVSTLIQERSQTSDYIAAPKVGDVYEILQENGRYTLYLLTQFKDDSVGFRIHNYEGEGLSGLRSIQRDYAEDYAPDVFYFGKDEIHTLSEKRKIIHIQRHSAN